MCIRDSHLIEQPGHLFTSVLRRGGMTRRFAAQQRRFPIGPVQVGSLQKGLQQRYVLFRGYDDSNRLFGIEFFGTQEMWRRGGCVSPQMEGKT